MIRQILLGTAAVVALTVTASAADLPSRKAPVAYAPVAMAYSCTGFYVGGRIGYAWAETRGRVYNPGGVFVGADTVKAQGLLGGVHAGYNMQSGSIVYGLEADLEAANVRGSKTLINGDFVKTRLGTQGSLRGRLGYAIDRTLLYVTGGLAIADIQNTYLLGGRVPAIDSISKTRFGWTLGAGIEYAIANNWTARAEYRYTDFGTKSDTLVMTYPGFTSKNHVTDHAVRLGVSYKFGGPSAIVAKY